MPDPLISVVIPSFNRYEYLLNAIKSVKEQTYSNIEILIINDGSTQKDYQELNSDKDLTVINLKQNQKTIHGFGPGAIRNFGIEQSKGKYIAFLDDDDYWLENKLDYQLSSLVKKELKFSCSEAFIGEGPFEKNEKYQLFLQEYYYMKLKSIYLNPLTYRFKKFDFNGTWDEKFLRKWNCVITSSVMVEKELLEKVGGFRNLPSNADWDCWRSLVQFSTIDFCKEPLLYYDNSHGGGRKYKK